MSKMKQQHRNRITKWALYGLLFFIAFAVADLSIIYYRDHFLPNQAPPKKESKMQASYRIDRGQYSPIISRNIFSSAGLIPDPLKPKDDEQGKKNDVPVLSSLPITLIGTLVHSNPNKSVAAVEIKSKSISGSYSVGAEIEGMAKIESIQRNIVYFRNMNNGALEYIEISQGLNKLSFDGNEKTTSHLPVSTGKEIQSVGNNTFRIKRSDLNKYLNDLSSLLMQARAVPNRDPSTGEINGYRLVDYQPGSIFEQLNIPRNTLIKTAGGEPVTNVQAAMEMFNKMKKENNVELGLEVNGSAQTYKYEISN
jgi:general secretion pathway protein C